MFLELIPGQFTIFPSLNRAALQSLKQSSPRFRREGISSENRVGANEGLQNFENLSMKEVSQRFCVGKASVMR